MTPIQKLLGDILRRRIVAELAKDSASQKFEEIETTIAIFLADSKLTMEQYSELTEMMTPLAETTAS